MRIELSEAISLILTLPAHRSNNEGHRKLGEKALELLIEYKDLGETIRDKKFNRKMICSVMATVRAFSIERDRINGVWDSIRRVKERRERWLDVARNLSPLEKNNYWSKIFSIIVASGLTVTFPLKDTDIQTGVVLLILILVALEIISKSAEVLLSVAFERYLPIEQQYKWEIESLAAYKTILRKFIIEAVDNYKDCFPDVQEIYGYKITDIEAVKELQEMLVEKHLYFNK